MRLIDADALKETFEIAYKEARHDREYANAFFSDGGEVSTEWWCVEDMVDNAPTIEPQKWIPCSERLPEDKQVVFVQDTNETMWIWKYFDENLEYSGPYQWEDENGDWQLIDEVVAWMPLPEPYKEEE